MKAIHGGKTKNDRIDAEKIAMLLRGGMLPQAYAYPAEMRAARDLLRRRSRLVRMRAELLGHVQLTRYQYNLPAFRKKLAYRAGRQGVVDHFGDPVVRRNVELDVEVIDHLETSIKRLEAYLVRRTKVHDVHTFHRLRTVPGIGQILAMTLLYEIEDISRFPRVQEFVSYARLVKGQKRSAGKQLGTQGGRMGNRHLKWAFSEAAVLYLRESERARKYVARLEARHGKGKALSILSAKLGRAVYFYDAPRGGLRRGPTLRYRIGRGRRRAGCITAALSGDSVPAVRSPVDPQVRRSVCTGVRGLVLAGPHRFDWTPAPVP